LRAKDIKGGTASQKPSDDCVMEVLVSQLLH